MPLTRRPIWPSQRPLTRTRTRAGHMRVRQLRTCARRLVGGRRDARWLRIVVEVGKGRWRGIREVIVLEPYLFIL